MLVKYAIVKMHCTLVGAVVVVAAAAAVLVV
jgi:hypothetical protein